MLIEVNDNSLFGILIILIIIAAVVIIGVWLIKLLSAGELPHIETPEKRAGRQGERIASYIIREIMVEDDVLLTNVHIEAEGKETEIDNLIVNSNGVFIIEVKNYAGDLFGGEDDFEWIKNKFTPGGSFYQKKVKNPIKQAKRQVYILSHYLKDNKINVWIEGYAFLIQMNSPVESPYMLKTQNDIDRVIHNKANKQLPKYKKERIIQMLTKRQ